MSPKEAIAVLLAAFPRHELQDPTVRLYGQKLGDIAPSLLEATIHRVVERSKFFPSIAELRETAAELAGLLPPSAEEALAVVRRADAEEAVWRRDGSYAYTERFWRWPDEVSPAVIGICQAVLERLGDPVGKDGDRLFAWDTEFKRVYASVSGELRLGALADLSHAVLLYRPTKALTVGDHRGRDESA